MEHAVIVRFKLAEEFGSERERVEVEALEDALAREIDERGIGEFDGDEFGGYKCVLFMYGRDADDLFAAVAPVLRAAPIARGGTALKRYGDAGDLAAREVTLTI